MRENFAGFDGCKSSAFVIRPAEPLREPEADEDDREKRRNVRSQLKGLRGGAGAGRGRKTIFPKWEKIGHARSFGSSFYWRRMEIFVPVIDCVLCFYVCDHMHHF